MWDRSVKVTGLRGYVTNIPAGLIPATEVISSYHELWHVERSFRMSTINLKAWPISLPGGHTLTASSTITLQARHILNTLNT